MIDLNKSTTNNERLLKSLFLVPTKQQIETGRKLDLELNTELSFYREAAQESAAFEGDSNSLVKRGESPTLTFQQKCELKHKELLEKHSIIRGEKHKEKVEISSRINKALASEKRLLKSSLHTCPEPISLSSRKSIPLNDYLKFAPREGEIYKNEKTCVRMYHQAWSGKYRMGLEVGALGAKVAPPETSGERITKELTKNAVTSILESGAYMSATRTGYTTFATLTFSDESRQDLESLITVSGNKSKNYTYKYRALNPSSGRMKTFKEKYTVTCIEGVPAEFNQEHDEDITSHSNCIPATGAFTPISIEPKTTIGKEVSRFFDAAQKMYQRGWVAEYQQDNENTKDWVDFERTNKIVQPPKIMFCPEMVTKRLVTGEIPTIEQAIEQKIGFEPYNNAKHTSSEYLEREAVFGMQEKGAPLDYMWVAEQPDNKEGGKNPHVHVMMRWGVDKCVFRSWAKRLEQIWGHGFTKLEKIRTPQAASNYLLKAVGYLTKGGSSSQGDILGNRYGISSSARAPKWECIGEFYADNFIAILGELREKLNRKKAKNRALLNAEINKQSGYKKKVATLTNVNEKSYTERRRDEIDRIKKRLMSSDESIKAQAKINNELPFINEFAVGSMTEVQATKFLHFAMRERWWNAEVKTNRYNSWDELKQNTIEALKINREYWRGYEHLIETKELSFLWAKERANYELITDKINQVFDEYGNEYELVA